MSLTAYKLHFLGPIHISDARSDYGRSERVVHSDTLYAALLAVQGMLSDNVHPDLGCSISSLFPFTVDEDSGSPVFFFPKPLIQLQDFLKEGYDDIKKLKRVEWLGQKYFEEILEGDLKSVINSETVQGSYLCKEKIDKDFVHSQVVPRVAVPRSADENDGETNIFYIERTYFKEGSGLYFLAYGDTNLLDKLLSILQYEGIGTDRNVGFGHFSYEKVEDFQLIIPEQSDYCVSLSLFNSDNKELIQKITSGEKSAWEIVKRGGWMASQGNIGIRKKSVYMFSEGSIFLNQIQGVEQEGKVDIDLKPDEAEGFVQPGHSVWRNGRALFLPIKI